MYRVAEKTWKNVLKVLSMPSFIAMDLARYDDIPVMPARDFFTDEATSFVKGNTAEEKITNGRLAIAAILDELKKIHNPVLKRIPQQLPKSDKLFYTIGDQSRNAALTRRLKAFQILYIDETRNKMKQIWRKLKNRLNGKPKSKDGVIITQPPRVDLPDD